MSFELMQLPYAENALEPVISAQTISYHYGKHHRGYINKLNKAVDGSDYAGRSLEEIVKTSSGALFNNAAQVWNHDFYWNSLSPAGGGNPQGDLAEAITSAFGSAAEFKSEFATAAKSHFGSGWAWLLVDVDGNLKIESTSDADTPIAHSKTPLLTLDVWEHAYYLDFQNARAEYVDQCIDRLLDWGRAARRFTACV